MRLARGTDFAYRILMLVAMNCERSLTVELVCSSLNLSRSHGMKLVAKLAKGGFLVTNRGRGGGLGLGLSAKDIRLGDVARHMEADFGMLECHYRSESNCKMFGGCELTFIMHRALNSFLASLNDYSLADMLDKSQNSQDLVLPACFHTEGEQEADEPDRNSRECGETGC